jgi:hypothetical protein
MARQEPHRLTLPRNADKQVIRPWVDSELDRFSQKRCNRSEAVRQIAIS